MKIAVSGLNNTDNPAPGVGVAKSLQKEHKIVGLSYDPNEPGIYQGLYDRVFLMPYPTLGYQELKSRLEYIKKECNIEAVIPNLDVELPLYIKYQEELEKMGIRSYLPTLECFEARDKSKLAKLSQKLGIKHPKTIEISSLDELVEATKELDFPLMVKGNYYKAYRANNIDEAIEHYYSISNEWGFPLLIQEIISGVEINFIGVGNGKELVAGIGMKKLTTTELGKVWSAVSIKNQKLLDVSKDFVSKLGWRGAFEFEAISNGRDIYLIEINPRLPAWVHFATILGVNLPQILIELMQGKEVKKQLDYKSEKMYVRYVEESVVDLKDFTKLLSTKEL
jgi:carbamoyl-phosphate synthase large subunit